MCSEKAADPLVARLMCGRVRLLGGREANALSFCLLNVVANGITLAFVNGSLPKFSLCKSVSDFHWKKNNNTQLKHQKREGVQVQLEKRKKVAARIQVPSTCSLLFANEKVVDDPGGITQY